MATEVNSTQRKFIICSHIFSYVVISIATFTLLGWLLNIDFLKRIVIGTVAMNPLTALLFIFSGISFLLIVSQKPQLQQLGRGLAILIAVLSAIKIGEYLFEVQNGIDTWLFHDSLSEDKFGNISNRMAINTASCFLLQALSLLFVSIRAPLLLAISDYLVIGILLISLLSILGYLYVVDAFFAFLKNIPMALHTAISFFLLGQATWYAFPNQGIMRHITSEHAGGTAARKILPAIILTPIVIGSLLLLLEWQQLLGADFGAAIFTLGVIVLLFSLILPIIISLNAADAAKKSAELKLLQSIEELKVRTSQLEYSNKELESFSYSISHDMRAPLRAVNAYAQVLLQEYNNVLDNNAEEIIQTISRNGKKMGKLIDSLLRFVQIGKTGIIRHPINMEVLVKSVVESLVDTTDSRAEFIIEELPAASGDPLLIEQVFENLIANAIKFTSKKASPVIHIGSAYFPEKGTTYFIKDNGDGFDMRHYNKLFQVFHRLHGHDEFEGTGVGLAITQKIIFFHNGNIWAEGEKNKGATFYFTLN